MRRGRRRRLRRTRGGTVWAGAGGPGAWTGARHPGAGAPFRSSSRRRPTMPLVIPAQANHFTRHRGEGQPFRSSSLRRPTISLVIAAKANHFARHPCAGQPFRSSSRRRPTISLVIPADHHAALDPGEGRDPEPRFLVVASPPACRLRGGRFERLPPLESLFSCWPKRKVTQREWPQELAALPWDKLERSR
jgi:hypothetical protein